MAVPKVIFDRRLNTALLAVVIYLALFTVITYSLGKGMAIAAVIPVVVIAWVYGFWGGIWAGLLSAPFSIGLCMIMGLDWYEKFYVGGVGVAGTAIMFFVGMVVGKLHDYYQRIQDELEVRKRLEAELQQHRTRLEDMVREKTVQLEATNQQLEASLAQLKASQSDIRRARDFMESTFHCAIDGLIVADATGRVLMGNRAVEQLLGYGEGELIGKHIDAIIYDDAAIHEQTMALMRELYQKNFVENIEALLMRCDGGTVPVELNSRFLKSDEGEITGSVTSVRDSTARRQALEQLRQSRDFLADIFRAIPDVIIVTDGRGDITAANDAVRKIIGYSPEELVGQSSAILVSDDEAQRQAGNSLLAEFFQKGYLENREVALRKKDNTVCTVEWNGILEKDDSGTVTGSIAVLRDCSGRKSMEQQLRQAQKMEAIGTLAGGIAHDFNNILTAISGFADLSLQAVREAPLKNYITYIVKAANRARDLVRQILAFSRQAEQEMRPVQIAPLLKEALKFLRATLPSSIEIRQSIACSGDVVLADPTQIHQVIMNLCTNAGHAMRECGGVLNVEVETLDVDGSLVQNRYADLVPGRYVRLRVSDTGHGMTAELLDHIFEPYFTTKEKGEGTGLGLAVVHGIVTQHRGAITVSTEPGRGSVFDVLLPLMDVEVEPPAVEMPLRRGSGESVLFVDDEDDIAFMARTLLEDLGYRVTALTSPQAALELIRRGSTAYDLLITDRTMPGMNGLELAEAVFAVAPALPVILLSGLAQSPDTAQLAKTGIRDFIIKPFEVHALAGRIRAVLEAPRPAGEEKATLN